MIRIITERHGQLKGGQTHSKGAAPNACLGLERAGSPPLSSYEKR
jgi:hypothetical protein